MYAKKKEYKSQQLKRFFSSGSIPIPFLFLLLMFGGALLTGSFFSHQSTVKPDKNNNTIVDPLNKDPLGNLQIRKGQIVTPTPLPPTSTPTNAPSPMPTTPISTPRIISTPAPTPNVPTSVPMPTGTPAPTPNVPTSVPMPTAIPPPDPQPTVPVN